MKALFTIILLGITLFVSAQEGNITEENRINTSTFFNRFKVYQPIYFGLSNSKAHYSEDKLLFAKFQISFRFQVFDIFYKEKSESRLSFNLAYTQTSFWDLESKSQPFYDNSYKPAMFLFYEKIGGNSIKWVDRIDIETGYQHHSNGRDGYSSRSIDWLYVQPVFTWRLFKMSHIILAPKLWLYILESSYNSNIKDYWGYGMIDLTWRADFGLQIRTYTNPAKESTSFYAMVTYPLSKLWKPLNFYALVSYYNGTGETILDYDKQVKGWIFGIALTR